MVYGKPLAFSKSLGLGGVHPASEPPLGNPLIDGQALVSTILGVRSWLTLPVGGGGGMVNLDGGAALSTYLISQNIEGGAAVETYLVGQHFDGGTA